MTGPDLPDLPEGVWLDYDGNPCDFDTWADLMRSPDRIVDQTQVGDRAVSTCWLGINYNHMRVGPPLIYETCIFPEVEIVDRYPTRASAQAGHDQAVAAARQASP